MIKLKLYEHSNPRVIKQFSYDNIGTAQRDLGTYLLKPLDPWTFEHKVSGRKERFVWKCSTSIATMVMVVTR